MRARRTRRPRRRLSEQQTTEVLFTLLVEDIVMNNSELAKSLFFSWQPRETAEAALALARSMTPERLLMAGGAS